VVLEDLAGQIGAAMDFLRAGLDPSSLARIRPERLIEDAVREADLVIEAAPEDMETKLEIFTILDKSAPPRSILASTTSALSVTEIASITLRAGRTLGMHFFAPIAETPLLEIVEGLETEAGVLAEVEEVGRRMGKQTVRLKDAPGFLTARLGALMMNEAFQMLHEGTAGAAAIDQAARLGLGQAAGPLERADSMGLDNLLQELERLQKAHGEKFRPSPLLVQYVKAGRTGKRSGRGVFEYPK
jgi:3-hydroxybutyryl-CoA dehydrogenase